MARRDTNPTEAAETKPKPEHHEDVLIFIDQAGAIACVWNDPLPAVAEGTRVVSARIPVQNRVRLEPGLSFCPGASWSQVGQSPSFVAARDRGDLRVIAGHEGDLSRELARTKGAALASMIDRSAHVSSLRRLQAIEEHQDKPRSEVLNAIEARLDTLKVEVARDDRARRQQRRVHRRGRR